MSGHAGVRGWGQETLRPPAISQPMAVMRKTQGKEQWQYH